MWTPTADRAWVRKAPVRGIPVAAPRLGLCRGCDIPSSRGLCRAARSNLGSTDSYAYAFSARPGKFWRLVYQGRRNRSKPTFCPEPVEWRSRFKNGQGWHAVDSCDGHVDDELVGVRRMNAWGVRGRHPSCTKSGDGKQGPGHLNVGQTVDMNRSRALGTAALVLGTILALTRSLMSPGRQPSPRGSGTQ